MDDDVCVDRMKGLGTGEASEGRRRDRREVCCILVKYGFKSTYDLSEVFLIHLFMTKIKKKVVFRSKNVLI